MDVTVDYYEYVFYLQTTGQWPLSLFDLTLHVSLPQIEVANRQARFCRKLVMLNSLLFIPFIKSSD